MDRNNIVHGTPIRVVHISMSLNPITAKTIKGRGGWVKKERSRGPILQRRKSRWRQVNSDSHDIISDCTKD